MDGKDLSRMNTCDKKHIKIFYEQFFCPLCEAIQQTADIQEKLNRKEDFSH